MSFSKIHAAQIAGLHADIVSIETDLSNGLHAFSIVGLGDRAVEEAKDRISAAIKNSGFVSPKQRNQKVVISLAPAGIRKEGTTFDLGMAVGYLLASGDVYFNPEKTMFIGELSLEGTVRGTCGILAMVRTAQKKGFKTVFVPRENAVEAALVPNMTILPVDSMKQLVLHVAGKETITPQPRTKIFAYKLANSDFQTGIDFGNIRGQENAKRALEIAATGRHNVAMYGPPGTGKTMLARAFADILPTLTHKEVLEVTEIHSIVGITPHSKDGNNVQTIITRPPFRAPHHTSSCSAIVGGGTHPKAGEITLAHRGIIFLDEFTEFDRRTIDSLRQPMEDKSVTVTRTKGSVTYPADCIYVLAMNPCGCGGKNCICTDKEIARYRKKISGAIADRIDIWISVSTIDYEKFLDTPVHNEYSSNEMAYRVKEARLFRKNMREDDGNFKNGNEIEKLNISSEASSFLSKSAEKLNLSARAYVRTANVARTIADLARSEKIKTEHIMEALQYRQRG